MMRKLIICNYEILAETSLLKLKKSSNYFYQMIQNLFINHSEKGHLVPMNPRPLYGLMKKLKGNVLMRPVVSYLNSPTHKTGIKVNSVFKNTYKKF